MWNRQYTDHELVDENNLALGFRDHVRRNSPDQWIVTRLTQRQQTAADMPGGRDAARSMTAWTRTPTKAVTPTPEEVINYLRCTAQIRTHQHPTNTLEVGGKLPIRITV